MRQALAITLLISGFFSTLSSPAAAEDIAAQYRMLEWQELVPENWEAPLVPPGHDSPEALQVPQEAVVAGLDGVRITLPGYIKTAEFENDQVKALLLVPLLPHHTKQHAHLDANQKVYVSLLEPVAVDKPMQPIWVVGTLTVETTVTEEGPAAYRIADAVITEYTY
jgi:uncharacterized protein